MVNWTLGNNLQWNSNRNQHIFIQENAFETVICKITSQPQWYIPSSTTAQHMLWMNHWYYHKHQEAHSLLDLYVHNLYSLHKIFTLIFCVLELSIVLTLKLGNEEPACCGDSQHGNFINHIFYSSIAKIVPGVVLAICVYDEMISSCTRIPMKSATSRIFPEFWGNFHWLYCSIGFHELL